MNELINKDDLPSWISDFGGNPSRAVRRAASCFGLPEIFRAAENTTCYYRLVMNFPSSNCVLTFSLILRLRKALAAVSVPLSVQSYGSLFCCKIASYM